MPWRRIGRFLYGAAASIFLFFSLQALVFATPIFGVFFEWAFDGDLHVAYSSCWTVWPGTLHVKNLELTGEDDNIQWHLGIDQVVFSFSFTELFRREFHATRVRANGVIWAMRMKQVLLDVNPEKLFGLPPIAGMDGMGLTPYGPDELDDDSTYRLWSVRLDDVDATGAREIWIDKLHLIGDAHISGGFYLKPMRNVKVMLQVQAEPLGLLIGDDYVASDLRGRVAATVHPFDPREGGGPSQMDLAIALDGTTGNLAFVQRMLPDGDRLSAEPGPIHLDVMIENGKVRPASRAELSTSHLHFAHAPFRADSAVRVSLLASSEKATAESPVTGSAAADLTGLVLNVRGADAKPVTVKRLRVAAITHQMEFGKPFAVGGLSADIDEARMPDLHLLDAFIPEGSKVSIDGGSAELHGHLDTSTERALGGLFFSLKEARMTGADVHLRADVEGSLRVHGDNPTRGPVDFSGSHISIDRAEVTGAGGRPWWGRFEFPKGSFDAEKKSVALSLQAKCLDSRPLRTLFAVEGVPSFVATIFTMPGLEIKGDLRAGPGLVKLSGLDAHGDGASIRANYEVRGEEKRGEALIRLGIATAGLDLNGGKTKVILLGATSWFDGRNKAQTPIAAGDPKR